MDNTQLQKSQLNRHQEFKAYNIYTVFKMSSKNIRKKRKVKQIDSNSFEKQEETANQNEQSLQQAELKNLAKHEGEKQMKVNETGSHNKIKSGDDETVGGESIDQTLPRPYQFLKFANPPLHTIFLPHFTPKSITFVLSLILALCFIILLIYSYTKPLQNKLSWNCSIFQLQNKYYPRIRFNYEFWRVPISLFFHSNIAHFVLNLIGMQIYGYFVQWYFGKIKYVVTLGIAGVLAFFMGCVAVPTSVSTCSSALLFSILALKLIFLYQYKDYKPLQTRKVFIYLLFCLILGINLIPIFVNNNVDFTAHISGFVTGICIGIFVHINKTYPLVDQTLCQKIIKFVLLVLLGIAIVICIVLVWVLPDNNGNYAALNQNIVGKCTDPNQE